MNDAKTALGLKIKGIKKKKGWTWAEVAEKLGHATVWTCAACLGQMSMTPETAEKTGVLFDLSEDEAQRLSELGEAAASDATDLFTFTSRINERFEMSQKLWMIEQMWRVAYADGRLTEHERHVLWRIADLLHVPQGAYVHARLRAQQPLPGPA